MEILEDNYEAKTLMNINDEENENHNLPKEDKKYFLIKCLTCENILSRSIEMEFLESSDNNKFSFISFPLLISIKTSKKKNLESVNDEKDFFVFKKISCLFCRTKIGKYIISSTDYLIEKLEKVKIDNKSCGL